ncbi:hypothetical protein [Enterococcus gilvus]|uniref:hypothetical protein n=1 Tax=Enterococcus gilvus TaxID=160453 RepID=UPI0028D8AF05|nr:hypothetical protein [Enterococcus gilvus]
MNNFTARESIPSRYKKSKDVNDSKEIFQIPVKKLKKKQIVNEDTGKVMVEKNEIEYTYNENQTISGG